MRKFIYIGLIIAIALIVVGGAGVAYAQFANFNRNAANPITVVQETGGTIRQFSYGPGGMMGEYGYGPGGMMGQYGDGFDHRDMMGGYGYGPGMMGGDEYGPGMMGRRGTQRGMGFMHDYMISAFAEAVGLTSDEVETRLANGETFKEIAIAQGKTEADLPDLLTQVRKSAMDKAVADGVITQAQADLMLEHMSNFRGPGYGPGYGFEGCPMWDEQQEP